MDAEPAFEPPRLGRPAPLRARRLARGRRARLPRPDAARRGPRANLGLDDRLVAQDSARDRRNVEPWTPRSSRRTSWSAPGAAPPSSRARSPRSSSCCSSAPATMLLAKPLCPRDPAAEAAAVATPAVAAPRAEGAQAGDQADERPARARRARAATCGSWSSTATAARARPEPRRAASQASATRSPAPPNAHRQDYATSVVMYRPGFRAEGLRLASDLGVKVVGPLDGIAASALARRPARRRRRRRTTADRLARVDLGERRRVLRF